jgi:hypothetical protein
MARWWRGRWPAPMAAPAALLVAAVALLGRPEASRAGEPGERMVTVQSIWSQADAIQRASQQLPKGVVVLRTRCTEVNVRTGNYRYICTLTYRPAGSDPAPPAP